MVVHCVGESAVDWMVLRLLQDVHLGIIAKTLYGQPTQTLPALAGRGFERSRTSAALSGGRPLAARGVNRIHGELQAILLPRHSGHSTEKDEHRSNHQRQL